MKNYFSKLAGVLLALLTMQNLVAQNPIWTLPEGQYNQSSQSYVSLPQPSGSDVYQGDPAEYVHAGYTGPTESFNFLRWMNTLTTKTEG